MYLKRIEILGFKSFAKKSVLEFRTPITAIVGPNGSGKSNVAEAFSFVLGEQSIKSMRGKKGEDLIYNGANSGSRANRAGVKVIFDNHPSADGGPSERLLEIPFDEVVVERIVHRDATNQYLINGSQVRLKDVVELLSGAHIGPSGHHIISQGESDKVLNVNPRERKTIVEEALGLKIYQIKRRESDRKLDRTKENIEQIESLRREIRPHLSFLEKQVRKIEKTLELRDSLVFLYKEYFKREDEYLKGQNVFIKETRKEPQKNVEKIDRELKELEQLLEFSKKESKSSLELTKIEFEISKLREYKDKSILDLGRLEGELLSTKRIFDRRKERPNSKNIDVDKVQDLIKEVEEMLDKVSKSDDISAFQKVISDIKARFKSFSSNVISLKIKGEYGLDEIKKLQTKVKLNKETIEKIISNEKDLKDQYEDLAQKLEKEKDSGIETERKIFKLKTERSELQIKLNELKILFEKTKEEESEFKKELTEGALFVGKEVLKYKGLVMKDKDGSYVTVADILAEKRDKQLNRRREIEKIKIRLEEAGGASGEEIIQEHTEVKERDEFLEKEINDLKESAKSLKSLISDLEIKLDTEFKQGLDKINEQFQEFFSVMFGGGKALLKVVQEKTFQKNDTSLEVEESDKDADPTSSGIEIEVNLPRKKIKSLMMLSGGERALTSIALLFAMSQVNPPPFIVLDETDAALDEANSKKYGDMIKDLSLSSQLILITHNRETMSRAGVLYGITMDNSGVSKLLSVDLEEAIEVSK